MNTNPYRKTEDQTPCNVQSTILDRIEAWLLFNGPKILLMFAMVILILCIFWFWAIAIAVNIAMLIVFLVINIEEFPHTRTVCVGAVLYLVLALSFSLIPINSLYI